MAPKGELEVVYGSPWGGVDYSRPVNVLDPQFLAPGTVNTSQINGFLTSSPWIGLKPYNFTFATGEHIMGIFYLTQITGAWPQVTAIIVTNVAVYNSYYGSAGGNPTATQPILQVLHAWTSGELAASGQYRTPGNCVSFCVVNGTLYLTSLAFNGIFQITNTMIWSTATTYVKAQYLIELGGRLFAAQCAFPTGGGTGTGVLPTVAWSGPGEYAGSGGSDPWNPVNNLGGGFNELADVPDQITGLAGIGRSALIFRQQGISQTDPNPGTSNSGLQPFTFYHLWASSQGVGAIKNTVAQYGQQAIFTSSDNVYQMSISAGLQILGPRIIAKIIADRGNAGEQLGNVQNFYNDTQWYFSSIVNIAGQLHYLLQFSASFLIPGQSAETVSCKVYDFNLSENAWHEWNLEKYFSVLSGSTVLAFSCPIVQLEEVTVMPYGAAGVSAGFMYLPFIMVGFYFDTGLSTGDLNQLVPLYYDYSASPFLTPSGLFLANLYKPDFQPQTTIVFRAETVSLGHKISVRRVRVQAANAPTNGATPGSAQQQALVTLTGTLMGNLKTEPLSWTGADGQPRQYMQGNQATQGASIQTYYADAILSDEMIQASITSPVNTAKPLDSLASFRIATASVIMEDPTGTTQ